MGVGMNDPSPINGIAPFFLVEGVARSIAYYRDALGFDLLYVGPDPEPFFAMFGRGGAMLMVKAVGAKPMPNPERHPDARWDAYVNAADPDALHAEFSGRGVRASVPLSDTDDGLRGFEVKDPDGHVLFFGRPATQK